MARPLRSVLNNVKKRNDLKRWQDMASHLKIDSVSFSNILNEKRTLPLHVFLRLNYVYYLTQDEKKFLAEKTAHSKELIGLIEK